MKSISRKEALNISSSTLLKAEQARLNFAEEEAKKGLSMEEFKIKSETKLIKPIIIGMSCVAIPGAENKSNYPLSFGNYFSFKEGYCINMWAENLEEIVSLKGICGCERPYQFPSIIEKYGIYEGEGVTKITNVCINCNRNWKV